jgi:branched-chain amino acid transport system substrate-binding protein
MKRHQKLRKWLTIGGSFLSLACGTLASPGASAYDGTVKIGVLTDLNGPYAHIAGEGSVVATRMAVEDCLQAECKGMKIDVLSADHQNKADLAASIARRWIDQEKVDAFGDLVNASVQLAMQALVKQENRVALYPGGTTRLTNEDCAPDNSVQWMWDTYSQVAGVTKGLAKPGSKWFFVTADYAFGAALQKDATNIVESNGGKIIGTVRHPFPSFDFSSFLLQAQSSGADYIALANAGGDAISSIKQATEFGIGTGNGQKLVALILTAPEIVGMGLSSAQNTILSEGFYWDLDESTRAWSKRFMERYKKGIPSLIHAGAYSATLHYLKAVAAAQTNEAKAVVKKMRELKIEDAVVRNASLRPDGRMIHDTFLFRVKKPEESKSRDDVYALLETTPANQAFKPLEQSTCPALQSKKK